MDALPAPIPTREDLNRLLAEQRRRVREFLANQRQRVRRVENELADRLHRFQEQLRENHKTLADRQVQLDAAESEYLHKSEELESALQQRTLEESQLTQLRVQLQQRAAELDAQQETIRLHRLETESQRRRIARELRGQHQRQWDELRRRQAELEQMATHASRQMPDAGPPPAPVVVPPQASESDLQRRLEMAMADIRQLRTKNADLEKQLAEKPVERASDRPVVVQGGLNWEAEKRRILAALEQFDSEDEEQVAERLRIEEVIHTTDQALREKDQELAEMRQVLQEQSSNLGGLAVGASALGELLDQDALICEERENLKRLQKQWEDTLRQAEVDISLERAKLARERLEIEEKLRAYENLAGKQDAPSGKAPDREKRSQGRWLSRLGLKDQSG